MSLPPTMGTLCEQRKNAAVALCVALARWLASRWWVTHARSCRVDEVVVALANVAITASRAGGPWRVRCSVRHVRYDQLRHGNPWHSLDDRARDARQLRVSHPLSPRAGRGIGYAATCRSNDGDHGLAGIPS